MDGERCSKEYGYISAEDAISNELISYNTISTLPNEAKCLCGRSLVLSANLRQLICTDDKCKCKISKRLYKMLRGLGIESWSENDCFNAVSNTQLPNGTTMKNWVSPFMIFDIKKRRLRLPDIPNEKLDELDKDGIRRVRLYRMVELCNITGIEGLERKIFNGYRSIKDAYDDIELGGVPFIADKLGISNSNCGVLAWKVYNRLIESKEELKYGEQRFEIYNPVGEDLCISIANNVEGYTNKSEFIMFVNIRYAGHITATMIKSVTSKCNILINDNTNYDGETEKVKTARAINKKAIEETGVERIKIMTSKQFIEMMDKKYPQEEEIEAEE